MSNQAERVDEPELLPCPCMTEFGHAPHKPGMCPDGERFTCECGESLRAEARVLWNKIREFGSYDKPAIEAIVVALTRSRPTVADDPKIAELIAAAKRWVALKRQPHVTPSAFACVLEESAQELIAAVAELEGKNDV